MQASQIPGLVPLPFANSGNKNSIPTASQIGIVAGRASLTDGFPPLTFTNPAAGGVPPAGADFNGILNLITAVQQWQCAGGQFRYNLTFATAIGGYPRGAVLEGAGGTVQWISLIDNNTTDPDSTASVNWVALAAIGIAGVSGLTNANVTLIPSQYSCQVIVLSGALTGNVQIIFPASQPLTRVINNTTGAFTATCKAALTAGVIIAQNCQDEFFGDGTSMIQVVGNTPPQFDKSARGATMAALQRALGGLSGIFTPVASATLTLAQLGNMVIFNGAAAGQTLTLPPAATVGGICGYWLQNTASVPLTIKGNGAELISTTGVGVGAGSSNTLTLGIGESTYLLSGGSSWFEQQGVRSASINALGCSAQSWQNVVGVRALSTIYTNTSGRAISVFISLTSTGSAGYYSLQVDGVAVTTFGSPIGIATAANIIVPNGSTYILNKGNADTTTALQWTELR